ncbi:MAG: hypothetical protein K8H88_18535, partial [Sandaracinaceae bacterium]|nr:hypothetical protein [Sandaracinaceae bacterium]
MLPDPELTAVFDRFKPHTADLITRPELGLEAIVVVDSTRLGPAAGGVRTRAYPDLPSMARDACRLAQSMTIKCALAGLDAGGGKIVVRDSPKLDRQAAFEELGRVVEAMQGRLRTAGDLGTTVIDLAAMAKHTRYVHTDTSHLAGSVARGVVCCAQA